MGNETLDINHLTHLLHHHQTTIRSVHFTIHRYPSCINMFHQILELLQHCTQLTHLSLASKYWIVDDHLIRIRDIISRGVWSHLETFHLCRDHMIMNKIYPPLSGTHICDILYELERHCPKIQKLQFNVETRHQLNILEALCKILSRPLSWPHFRHLHLDFQLWSFLEFQHIGTSLFWKTIKWYENDQEKKASAHQLCSILSTRDERVRVFWLFVGKRRVQHHRMMDPIIKEIYQLPDDLFHELNMLLCI